METARFRAKLSLPRLSIRRVRLCAYLDGKGLTRGTVRETSSAAMESGKNDYRGLSGTNWIVGEGLSVRRRPTVSRSLRSASIWASSLAIADISTLIFENSSW